MSVKARFSNGLSRLCTAVGALALALVGFAGTAHGQCGAGAGDCFIAHPTPGCNIVECCNAVCAADPFCCNNQWDSLCVGGANNLCGTCGGAGAGDCFVAHPQSACNIAECCDAVCAEDPFCCDTSWDGICAGEAQTLCGTCGGVAAGDCFTVHPQSACNDAECCNAVCAADPFCCNNTWDSLCVSGANDLCTCGGADTGDCFTVHSGPWCNISECCDAVCAADPFCCNTSWDSLCVSGANTLCSTCGGAGAGDCFTVHPQSACNNAVCCDAVCAADPFCCNNTWDSLCVSGANDLCTCGGADTGDCFTTHSGPWCNIPECCDAVCAADPFCCDTSWDGICVGEAEKFCATCGGAGAADCFTAHSYPACNIPECCDAVCAADPFCCNTAWDSICVGGANNLCSTCGGAGAGDCFTPHEQSACNIASCCEKVCAIDPFCCNVTWDGICANEAGDLCCPPDIAPPGGNGVVDVDDLLAVINTWGPCAGCPSDITGNGIVDVDDLLAVINGWGPCN